MSSLSSIFSLFSFLYVMVRRYLTVWWIRANLWLTNFDRGPATPHRHKIVVIGDSLALGVGDWVIPGGTAGVAPIILNQIALEGKLGGVRQRWFCYNRAVSGSTSADWLPPGDASEGNEVPAGETTSERELRKRSKRDKNVEHSKGGKHFERVFGKNRKSADAEIVVIMLGLADVLAGEVGLPIQALGRGMGERFPEQEIATTVKNVRRLVQHLRDQGKRVVLVDLPISGTVLSRYGEGKMKRINRQFRQCWKEATQGNGDEYAIVPLGSNHKTMRNENRAFDGLHFNKDGYTLIAKDVFSVIKPMCVAVEWSTWKQQLSGTKNATDVKQDASNIESKKDQ